MRMVATCHVSQQAHVHDESLPSDHLALRFDGLGWLMALDSAIDPHMQGVRWIHFISGKGVYLLGIAVKDAIHLCGFQEGIAAYLCSSQRRSRICGEEWVPCVRQHEGVNLQLRQSGGNASERPSRWKGLQYTDPELVRVSLHKRSHPSSRKQDASGINSEG